MGLKRWLVLSSMFASLAAFGCGDDDDEEKERKRCEACLECITNLDSDEDASACDKSCNACDGEY